MYEDCHSCEERERIIRILQNDVEDYEIEEIMGMLTELPEQYRVIDEDMWEPPVVVQVSCCIACDGFNKAVIRIKHKLEEVEIMAEEEFFYQEAQSLFQQL